MNIINKRFAKGKNSSVGELSIDGMIFCFVIEPLAKMIKPGKYDLFIRKELTQLTKRHQNSPAYKYWFKYHIEINAPGHSGVYFHIGNKWQDSQGCQLLCFRSCMGNGEQLGYDSTPAVKQFYSIVYPLLEKREKITYQIINNYET